MVVVVHSIYCFFGGSSILRSPYLPGFELNCLDRAEEGRWSAMRVVDESARLAGLWRVSVGLQDGAQAWAILMFVALCGFCRSF